jgi:serine/threonine protein kinase
MFEAAMLGPRPPPPPAEPAPTPPDPVVKPQKTLHLHIVKLEVKPVDGDTDVVTTVKIASNKNPAVMAQRQMSDPSKSSNSAALQGKQQFTFLIFAEDAGNNVLIKVKQDRWMAPPVGLVKIPVDQLPAVGEEPVWKTLELNTRLGVVTVKLHCSPPPGGDQEAATRLVDQCKYCQMPLCFYMKPTQFRHKVQCFRCKNIGVYESKENRRLLEASADRNSFVGAVQQNVHELYNVKEQLGVGSFAVVHRAVKKANGRVVAIKTIDKKKLPSSRAKDYARSEIQILRKLEHPHIIEFYEVFENPASVIVAMEFCPGGELFKELQKLGQYTEAVASKLMRQITSAIEYLHQQGIAHRDLKPQNILLTSLKVGGKVKLADFGLAVQIRPGQPMTDIAGTPEFMAPEMLLQRARADETKTDIWSLGVLAYILLSGGLPWISRNIEQLKAEISSLREIPFLPLRTWKAASDNARRFVISCLVQDPGERPSATSLLEQQQFLYEQPSPQDVRIDVPSMLSQFILKSTPLHEAASMENDAGLPTVIKLLQQPDTLVNARDEKGFTSLHLAAERRNRAVAKALMKARGIDVNVPNNELTLPLHYAVRKWTNPHEQMEVLQLLFERNAVVDARNALMETPLHSAAMRTAHVQVPFLPSFPPFTVSLSFAHSLPRSLSFCLPTKPTPMPSAIATSVMLRVCRT